MPHLNVFKAALKEDQLDKVVDTCEQERLVYLVQLRGLNQSPCRVCLHGDVKAIDREILSQIPLKEVGAKYGFKWKAVQAHWARHIREHIRKALGVDFAAQDFNAKLAKAMRRRQLAVRPRDTVGTLEFIVQDLNVIREALWGDIDASGQVFKTPDLANLLKINHKIVMLVTSANRIRAAKSKELDKKRNEPLTHKGKPRKAYQKWHGKEAIARGDGLEQLDDDLVSKDQQKEIDRAKKLNQEAEDAKKRTAN
jgi:hypothetical protein